MIQTGKMEAPKDDVVGAFYDFGGTLESKDLFITIEFR
jgi:hypothetical protein